MRIAINGFGRIGRAVFRIAQAREALDVVAVNDLFDHDTLGYLLTYDTVMGRFEEPVTIADGELVTTGCRARLFDERDPAQLPWGALEVDAVVESTGVFRARDQLATHLAAGAKRVVLTVPAKDAIDHTVVMGVNEDGLRPAHRLISNASCTTNCLAPVAKVLHEKFGVRHGLMTTTHAYTNDQKILDLPHSDLRRARAAAVSMIPTSTGAAKAVGLVLPELDGRLDGMAIRVPTQDVSVVDLVAEVERETTAEEVNGALKEAADGALKGILDYTEEPLVSVDYLGNPASSTVDGLSTKVLDGAMVKVISWYDNEWGFSCRMVDLIKKVGAALQGA